MSWAALVWRNLLRRPARTGLTAAGVGLGVALIVALLAITTGVHRTADDLTHVGRSDFGLFQSRRLRLHALAPARVDRGVGRAASPASRTSRR